MFCRLLHRSLLVSYLLKVSRIHQSFPAPPLSSTVTMRRDRLQNIWCKLLNLGSMSTVTLMVGHFCLLGRPCIKITERTLLFLLWGQVVDLMDSLFTPDFINHIHQWYGLTSSYLRISCMLSKMSCYILAAIDTLSGFFTNWETEIPSRMTPRHTLSSFSLTFHTFLPQTYSLLWKHFRRQP